MSKIKRIIKLVLNDIAEVYLYFFGFYIVCLILSHFFESWKLFFNWRAFHIGIIVFGILSLLSDKAQKIIFSEKNLEKFKKLSESINDFFRLGIKKINFEVFLRSFKLTKIIVVLIFSFIKYILEISVSFVTTKIKKVRPKNFLKVGIIIIVLIYFLSKEISVINFFVLAYALISILFIVESRIAAGIALIFLISCPFLLISKKEAMAETMAIYAYYFLVITVITQIREYMKEAKDEKILELLDNSLDKGL